MEILLLEDINGIGKKNDLLVVGDGFALNHLLPSRKALVATPTVRKRYADQIRKRAEEREKERLVQTNLAAAVAGKTVTISRKVAAKTSKLYAGVTEKDIADVIKSQLGIDLDESAVELEEHIKEIGTFQVPIRLSGATYSVTVVVTKE